MNLLSRRGAGGPRSGTGEVSDGAGEVKVGRGERDRLPQFAEWTSWPLFLPRPRLRALLGPVSASRSCSLAPSSLDARVLLIDTGGPFGSGATKTSEVGRSVNLPGALSGSPRTSCPGYPRDPRGFSRLLRVGIEPKGPPVSRGRTRAVSEASEHDRPADTGSKGPEARGRQKRARTFTLRTRATDHVQPIRSLLGLRQPITFSRSVHFSDSGNRSRPADPFTSRTSSTDHVQPGKAAPSGDGSATQRESA